MKNMKQHIPNALTSGNAFMGMFSIFLAIEGEFGWACIAIFAAAVLDLFDGRLARKYGVDGELGKQLDSLSDLISFGVAPSVLLYLLFFAPYGLLGMVLSLLPALSGAIRLARFNAYMYKNTEEFIGIPITLVGLLLAGMCLFTTPPLWVATLSVIALSLLMNSSLKMRSFKKSTPKKEDFLTKTE